MYLYIYIHLFQCMCVCVCVCVYACFILLRYCDVSILLFIYLFIYFLPLPSSFFHWIVTWFCLMHTSCLLCQPPPFFLLVLIGFSPLAWEHTNTYTHECTERVKEGHGRT
ncbi:hypothetical protein TCDM_05119 [Trypanosoma cruzi Dm28c]|uniref:Uncharacterized protein n=1 Tax=Trypanosoma cruzi Dm28c TaxID=1416333 RepID=V5BNV2_TRYCR|nr:hypothetical protein TCDM_05119 [Trypanosoma cruzi Dm28c]